MAHLTSNVKVDIDQLAPKTLDMERRGLKLFGLEVRYQRSAEEMSMRALAEHLGIRQDVISRIESGRWMPSEEEEAVLQEWINSRIKA